VELVEEVVDVDVLDEAVVDVLLGGAHGLGMGALFSTPWVLAVLELFTSEENGLEPNWF